LPVILYKNTHLIIPIIKIPSIGIFLKEFGKSRNQMPITQVILVPAAAPRNAPIGYNGRIATMSLAIGLIVVAFAFAYFENKKRWKENAESHNKCMANLDQMLDSKLDEALKRADEIKQENGVE
jgi:hypothetical protein